ncbi:MAG: family 20 glycosylhydrolase, partial [Bacteroidota bacterium]
AADSAGHFYALQSLRQLLPPELYGGTFLPNVQFAVPALRIQDAPTFGWRGYLLDVSRHFFTVEQVKDVIDMAAAQKMNRFHWHLTDDQGWRIEIKSRPKLTEIGAWRADRLNTDESISDWWGRAPQGPNEEASYGGFYSQEQIRDIIAYAKARYIEIIPEIDMPGHAQAAVASYPEIGCVNASTTVATGGVFKNNTLNPGRKATYAFATDVLNEVMDLFPCDYVHIGGDECNKEQWQVDPDAQAMMLSQGLETEEQLQSYFIRRLETIVNARGKKIIGWDEILEGGLAPNAVVMSWRGEAGGISAINQGHEVVMTPSKRCYLDLKQGHDDLEPNLGYSRLLLSTAYDYQVVPDTFTAAQAALIKGIQANMWTESISDWSKFTYMNYTRVWAVAENAWTEPERKDWDNFIRRVLHAFQRLDTQGIRYAESAFSPWLHHQRRGAGIEYRFETEANGLTTRYTTDGSQPDTSSTVYTAPFIPEQGQLVTAQNFLDGSPIGYPVSLELPIHLAAQAKVTDAAGTPLPKLTNLQYAKLTPVDSNWHKFGDTVTLELTFPEPTTVNQIQCSTLRYTISGVYPPETVEVSGIFAGGSAPQLLARVDQSPKANKQGRNKVTTEISFAPLEVTGLRIKLKAYANIPKGHFRAGRAARVYLDEVVVE